MIGPSLDYELAYRREQVERCAKPRRRPSLACGQIRKRRGHAIVAWVAKIIRRSR